MVFPKMFSDRGPKFSAQFWREFWRENSGSHSELFRLPPPFYWTIIMGKDLEVGLQFMASQNPTSLSMLLIWVKYPHNTLPSISMGICPFIYVHGYPPTWGGFQKSGSVEEETSACVCGVESGSIDLGPSSAQNKLAVQFTAPSPVSKVINPVAVSFGLPRSLRIHPTFHVTRGKPVKENSLVLLSRPLQTPQRHPMDMLIKSKM